MKPKTISIKSTLNILLLILLSTMLTAGMCSTSSDGEESDDDSDDSNDSNDDVDEASLSSCDEKTFSFVSHSLGLKFAGVDLLVMVDNSSSMMEEQTILTDAIFTLVNTLTLPPSAQTDPSWGFPAIDNMRVAVVTSDMGLQWGGGQTGGHDEADPICDPVMGNNAEFQGGKVTSMTVNSDRILCDSDGKQCPTGYTCSGSKCVSTDGSNLVNCPTPAGVVQTTLDAKNNFLATEVACLTQQSTTGCGIEQQLEAAVAGIERKTDEEGNNTFLNDNHILIVLVVSDEEDCSIRDNNLFLTSQWTADFKLELNIACNYPAENETFLYPVDGTDVDSIMAQRGVDRASLQTYYTRLLALKDNDEEAVVFGAIVGVPPAADSPCQGTGAEILANGCLNHPDMQIVPVTLNAGGTDYQDLNPVCVRYEGGAEVTLAKPGRRYVRLAQQFGDRSVVHSICEPNWTAPMKNLASKVVQTSSPSCFVEPVTEDCQMYVEIVRNKGELGQDTCPSTFYEGATDAEKAAARDSSYITYKRDDEGELQQIVLNCALPKIPAGATCEAADAAIDHAVSGWYYCTNSGENFSDACQDGVDNDTDGNIDCADWDCEDCAVCGGPGKTCRTACRYGVKITNAARAASAGYNVVVKCGITEDKECED